MKFKRLLIASTLTLPVLLASGYWYVFIAGAPQIDSPAAEQNTGLEFQVEQFNSLAMGEDRRYGVVLPPGYKRQPDRRYPVIILLHGGHGSERDFEDKARLTSILHDLYRDKRLPPSIVVTPDGSDDRGSNPFFDPDYLDGPHGQIASLIGSDLVQVIKSRYRTLNQPQFWAMGGISSGGWGALNIGLRHLDQFHIFFSHTGYFTDKSGAENSPQVFVQQIPVNQRKFISVYLDAGESDHKYLQATRQFHSTLNQLGISNQFQIFPGGHGIVGPDSGWNYWHKHLSNSLSFVGQRFHRALTQIPSPTNKKKTIPKPHKALNHS